MKLKNLFLAVLLIYSGGLFAQETTGPEEIIVGTFIGKTIPMRDFPVMEVNSNDPATLKIVPIQYDVQGQQSNPPSTIISNMQITPGGIQSLPIGENFIGVSQSESGYIPPDPTGAAGPNHYVHSVNSLVKIFNKTGTLLVGPVSLASFLGIGSNSGDPIVLYDKLADRWIVSEFGALNNSLAIGVSETNDPTGAYNVWQYVFPSFPDYPHYGIWHDGYYGTVNYGGSGTHAFAMERDVMIAGGANPQMALFTLPNVVLNPYTIISPEPANLIGDTFPANAPAYITYLQDDGWSGVSFDHLKVWEIDMDWNTIGNSTISAPLEIPTQEPFDAGELFSNPPIGQPGTAQDLNGFGGIISFAANYRSFGSYNSWLITFNTWIDNNETGGIRWVELRNDASNPWAIYQEGTYAIADGHSRYMSSAAMDAAGNIGMVFNIGSETLPKGLRYTGRFDGDPLGEMTVAETTIVDGVGVRTNAPRNGDYTHTTMDPDNFTFWTTGDFFWATNQWRTQIASFNLSGGFTADVGVANIIQPDSGVLTNSESVEISVRNYGLAPQSNIPVELRIDGNLLATENVAGPIAPNTVASYTFAQTVDLSVIGQTYSIEARTNLVGDEFGSNDPYTKEVTNLLANDVGPLVITAPVTGSGLNSTETVSVTLKNFGANSASNFDVQYTINGGPAVVETYTGTIDSEDEVSYDFTQTADLSALGSYTIVVTTSLTGDMNGSNDEITTIVENVLCQPSGTCSSGRGFELFSIAEINNASGCEGYGDFSNLIANLEPGTTNDLTVSTGFGNMYITVWIDYNDDSLFYANERVVTNYIIAPGQSSGSYTETFDLVVPSDATPGAHRMRARATWNEPNPANGCIDINYGETEDYTVNIGSLGVDDIAISEADIKVISLPNNQFEVLMQSDYDGFAYVSVYNVLGQELGLKRMQRVDDMFKLNLDMASASSGVYLVRVGGMSTQTYKTVRIVVK